MSELGNLSAVQAVAESHWRLHSRLGLVMAIAQGFQIRIGTFFVSESYTAQSI
jgi:hypothetical protein